MEFQANFILKLDTIFKMDDGKVYMSLNTEKSQKFIEGLGELCEKYDVKCELKHSIEVENEK